MSDAHTFEGKFSYIQENKFRLEGYLTYLTVGDLLKYQTDTFQELLKQESIKQVKIDLTEVKASDSSGIAFIIELIRLANENQKEVLINDVPEQMLSLAKLSSVEDLFSNEQ